MEANGLPMNRKDDKPGKTNSKEKRLAEALRANLQKRKVQMRAKRTGDADTRKDGIRAAVPGRISADDKAAD